MAEQDVFAVAVHQGPTGVTTDVIRNQRTEELATHARHDDRDDTQGVRVTMSGRYEGGCRQRATQPEDDL